LFNPAIRDDVNCGVVEIGSETPSSNLRFIQISLKRLLATDGLFTEIPSGVLGAKHALFAWNLNIHRCLHRDVSLDGVTP
tara:strand:- start:100 stop:339 length:240 start_codon:yes stop_codon:yes gene_type:complete